MKTKATDIVVIALLVTLGMGSYSVAQQQPEDQKEVIVRIVIDCPQCDVKEVRTDQQANPSTEVDVPSDGPSIAPSASTETESGQPPTGTESTGGTGGTGGTNTDPSGAPTVPLPTPPLPTETCLPVIGCV